MRAWAWARPRVLLMALWVGLCGLGALAPAQAAIEILDLPPSVSARYDLQWTMTATRATQAPLVISVEGGAPQMGYRLTLGACTARWESLSSRAGLTPVTVSLPNVGQSPTVWVLKRRPETVALLCNHRLLFTAPAPTPAQGTLHIATVPAGLTLGEVRYQPVDAPRFGDDFMRPDALARLLTATSPWVEDEVWNVEYYGKDHPGTAAQAMAAAEAPANPWQLSLFPHPKTTVNAFWMLYTGTGPSWIVPRPTQVPPHWDGYTVATAVKPEYQGAVGVLAAYQDAKNYLRFRWTAADRAAPDGPRMELVAMVDGTARVLATRPVGYQPGQWYHLTVRLDWQHVQAVVDGTVVLQAANPGPIEGRVGLYADGVAAPQRPALDTTTAQMYAVEDTETGYVHNEAEEQIWASSCIAFDDVQVRPWTGVGDCLTAPSYAPVRSGQWQPVAAGWTAVTPGRWVGGPTVTAPNTLTTTLQLPPTAQAGLLSHVTPDGQGLLWLVTPHEYQLIPLRDGQRLPPRDTAPRGDVTDAPLALQLVCDGAYSALLVNGTRVLEAYDPARPAGRCGVLAQTAGVTVGPLALTPLTTPTGTVAVHPGFAGDRYLAAWARAESRWVPAVLPASRRTVTGYDPDVVGPAVPLPTDVPGVYWYTGGWYGDGTVVVPLPVGDVPTTRLHLSPTTDATSGYTLQLVRTAGQLTLSVERRAQRVATATVPSADPAQLTLQRRGGYLIVTHELLDPDGSAEQPMILQSTPVLVYRDPEPLPVGHLGVTVGGAALPAAHLTVATAGVQETFEAAPTAWWTAHGVWGIMARYACDPKWNYYGGFGATTPALWSKAQLLGDQTVEAFLGVKMRTDDLHTEYGIRFRDLAVTICGDGVSVLSGYTVLRAATVDGGRATQLLRRGVVVAETRDPAFLLPVDGHGHRQWFATRIEKAGAEIRVFLDHRLALSYTDPDPLPGGAVAIWTRNNGLMVGRVNLSASDWKLSDRFSASPSSLSPASAPLVLMPGNN